MNVHNYKINSDITSVLRNLNIVKQYTSNLHKNIYISKDGDYTNLSINNSIFNVFNSNLETEFILDYTKKLISKIGELVITTKVIANKFNENKNKYSNCDNEDVRSSYKNFVLSSSFEELVCVNKYLKLISENLSSIRYKDVSCFTDKEKELYCKLKIQIDYRNKKINKLIEKTNKLIENFIINKNFNPSKSKINEACSSGLPKSLTDVGEQVNSILAKTIGILVKENEHQILDFLTLERKENKEVFVQKMMDSLSCCITQIEQYFADRKLVPLSKKAIRGLFFDKLEKLAVENSELSEKQINFLCEKRKVFFKYLDQVPYSSVNQISNEIEKNIKNCNNLERKIPKIQVSLLESCAADIKKIIKESKEPIMLPFAIADEYSRRYFVGGANYKKETLENLIRLETSDIKRKTEELDVLKKKYQAQNQKRTYEQTYEEIEKIKANIEFSTKKIRFYTDVLNAKESMNEQSLFEVFDQQNQWIEVKTDKLKRLPDSFFSKKTLQILESGQTKISSTIVSEIKNRLSLYFHQIAQNNKFLKLVNEHLLKEIIAQAQMTKFPAEIDFCFIKNIENQKLKEEISSGVLKIFLKKIEESIIKSEPKQFSEVNKWIDLYHLKMDKNLKQNIAEYLKLKKETLNLESGEIVFEKEAFESLQKHLELNSNVSNLEKLFTEILDEEKLENISDKLYEHLFSHEYLHDMRNSETFDGILTSHEKADLVTLTRILRKLKKEDDHEHVSDNELQQVKVILERCENDENFKRKIRLYANKPSRLVVDTMKALPDALRSAVVRLQPEMKNWDLSLKLPTIIDPEVIVLLDKQISIFQKLDQVRPIIDKVNLLIKRIKEEPEAAIESGQKITLKEFSTLYALKRMDKAHLQLLKYCKDIYEKADHIYETQQKAQEAVNALEAFIQPIIDNHYHSGDILGYVGKKKQACGKNLSLEEMLTCQKGGLTHGAKLFKKEGHIQISHVLGSYIQDSLGLYNLLISDVYQLDLSQLIDSTSEQFFKQLYGKNYLEIVQKKYQDIEDRMHAQVEEHLGQLENDAQQRLRSGIASFGLLKKLINKTNAREWLDVENTKHELSGGVDFDKIHSQFFVNKEKHAEKQICSEFASRATVAALVQLNREIIKDLTTKWPNLKLEDVTDTISRNFHLKSEHMISVDLISYLKGKKFYKEDGLLDAQKMRHLGTKLEAVLEACGYAYESTRTMIGKIAEQEVIRNPYPHDENFKMIHPQRMVELIQTSLTPVPYPKEMTQIFDLASYT